MLELFELIIVSWVVGAALTYLWLQYYTRDFRRSQKKLEVMRKHLRSKGVI